MNSETQSLAHAYDDKYRRPNFFGYRSWLYRPYIRAVASEAHLARGSRVLDLGCGQGFFTRLFAELGMQVLGIDISTEAIRAARQECGSSGAEFEVGDILSLPYEGAFDCAFVRSCSLYNSQDFEARQAITDVFLKYVKPGGVLIFDYYSKLCRGKKSTTWRYHSIAAVKKHFARYPQARVYFSLRVETILLKGFALSPPVTGLATLASRATGIGGELIAIVRKQ
jgi:SAM-dependent methyltransferase